MPYLSKFGFLSFGRGWGCFPFFFSFFPRASAARAPRCAALRGAEPSRPSARTRGRLIPIWHPRSAHACRSFLGRFFFFPFYLAANSFSDLFQQFKKKKKIKKNHVRIATTIAPAPPRCASAVPPRPEPCLHRGYGLK